MFNFKNRIKLLENYSLGGLPLTEVLPKFGMILMLTILIPLMFPSGRSFKYTDLIEGSIATKKVIAPFNFTVLKTPAELKEERNAAEKNVPFYFSFADSAVAVLRRRFFMPKRGTNNDL